MSKFAKYTKVAAAQTRAQIERAYETGDMPPPLPHYGGEGG